MNPDMVITAIKISRIIEIVFKIGDMEATLFMGPGVY